MTYGEAMECLLDGVITHNQGDILIYGDIRRFYIDQRTEHKIPPKPDVVKPLGRTVNDYWLYICPDCGLIHAIHNDTVKLKRPFDCGCHTHDKRKHTRKFIGPDKMPLKVPAKKIRLDVSEPGS